MPNKQNKRINTRTSKQNCTRLMQQSGVIKRADCNNLHPTTSPSNCAPSWLYLQDRICTSAVTAAQELWQQCESFTTVMPGKYFVNTTNQ